MPQSGKLSTMPRVLITGGAGFVGSHLVDRYLADGWEVVAVDNFSSGRPENVAQARAHRSFTLVELDVAREPERLVARLDRELPRCELLLHFASPASPFDYGKDPVGTMKANSAGTEACALLALEWGAELLFASTSEVYGEPLEHPQPETYWGNVDPIGPRSCYDESKRFGEALLMAYARSRGLAIRIVRIFNAYGPRMRADDGRVVPAFVFQALEGTPLTIFGDGKQTRSFCYIDDLVEGIVRSAASADTRGRVVNLGNPEEHTIVELAAMVSAAAGVDLQVAWKAPSLGEPTRRKPDISLARSLLGWSPRVSLDVGLRRTIADMTPQAAPSAGTLV
jgi:nucleoside-diphosphate-sugar epimerase